MIDALIAGAALAGTACLGLGVWLEARQQRAQDQTTGETAGRTRTGK